MCGFSVTIGTCDLGCVGEILGAALDPYLFLEINREDASTSFTDVDGGNLRP